MAAIAYDSESVAELELQELESPGGIAAPNVYINLMAMYLLRNDLCNAKFLWKRIPSSIKSSHPELGHMWSVGQKMWQRDFPGIYEVLNREWPENLKPTMNALHESTRRRAINLVSKAYSSINMDTFATLVSVPLADVNKVAKAEGWTTDDDTKMVTPKKPEAPPDPCLPNEEHLSILTDYILKDS
ncbi:COPS8 [Acanthosepion pharaonis]|uniref:COPS8 n=1 Tax=Acanthosepion pharaonis TaxID=158019 RepID=A0A812AR31_ACAPH|nr:COPS8 [Sepia pharaonis]